MLGGIVSGMVLTWVTVASELSSTVVLYSGPWRTLTIVMFQALEGSGAGVAVRGIGADFDHAHSCSGGHRLLRH
jgi:ABC-type Fe3+ transport system permease subunit